MSNIIEAFKDEQENLRNNTFEDKEGYVLSINQNSNNKIKLDETSTVRKNLSVKNLRKIVIK